MSSNEGAHTNAKTAYDYEVGANKNTTTVNAKIGLMYVSEYYYGASPDYWTLPGLDSNGQPSEDQKWWIGEDYGKARNANWLYTGLAEWTISSSSDDSGQAFYVVIFGNMLVTSITDYALRPTFNLSSSVKFVSGEGTVVNPIRIKL